MDNLNINIHFILNKYFLYKTKYTNFEVYNFHNSLLL